LRNQLKAIAERAPNNADLLGHASAADEGDG